MRAFGSALYGEAKGVGLLGLVPSAVGWITTCCILIVMMACDREEASFMFVTETLRRSFPSSSSLCICSVVSTSSTLAPSKYGPASLFSRIFRSSDLLVAFLASRSRTCRCERNLANA